MGEHQRGIHVIVTGGYRGMDKNECERMGLRFYSGSNESVDGGPVYSQHCLEIGAGSCELAIGHIRRL
jgi:hypothetical protein